MADEKDSKPQPETPPVGEPAATGAAAPGPAAPKPAAPATAPAAPPGPPGAPAAAAAPKPSPLTVPVPSVALDRLKERFADQIVEAGFFAGEVTVKLKHERAEEIWRFLRDDPDLRFDYLSNLTAVHWPERPKPFEVVYHLYSIAKRQRINLKLDVGEGEQPPTACRAWPTANWHEREVFDLFGIRFQGHPDMTRILMTDDWVGHPLRKDYPLEGKPEDHMQFRQVTTAEHVYTYDKAPIKGFGWKKEVEKTGEGRG
ncbi:MAG: NADH-quinone oxidoreductase subunit C [Acidobacteria bacterium]|nr:NADH-quinone oxidoreductase subunit C [Acidobacteriota bacterium]